MSPKSLDAIDQYVAKQVRVARIMANMSQTTLADELGVTFQQVQKYEKGVNRIGAGRLARIARVLNRPILYFYGEAASGKRIDSATDIVQDMMTETGGIVVAQAYSIIAGASPRVRHAFVELAKAVAAEIGEAARPARRKAA
jgi:transcriptional regulator with XRE-family HTH domain